MPKMLLVVVIAACQLLAFCGAQSTYFDVFVPGKQIAGTKSGCPCWFDPAQKFTKATECPCCPEGYKACGYPNHKRCYQAIDPVSNLPVASGRRMGCAGTAPYPAWTLSTKGAPCHFNMSDYSCAICGTDGYQCGNYANPIFYTTKTKDKVTNVVTETTESYAMGSYCRQLGGQYNYNCWGNIQDCRNNPLSCDPNASCVDSTFELIPDDPGTPMISERETRYYCQCNAGFVGNGFVCIVDGSISNSDRLLDLIEFL